MLRSAGYEAEVVEVGGGIRALRKDESDVVAGYAADEMPTYGRGQLLLPWPNRIENGRYEFAGVSRQLALSEPAKHNASHGLTRWANWHLDHLSRTVARASYRLHPQPGYPFELDLAVDYALGSAGLQVTISAVNIGNSAAPYGAGAHPYLSVGRRIDACVLTLPAATRSEMSERGIPSPAVPVEGGPFDFRSPRPIGGTSFDNPFGDVDYTDGHAAVSLADPETGRRATLTVDTAYPWLQLFSGDTLPSGARAALAVEPMTCPPNAFRSGIDLVRLHPGQTHTATFQIS